MNIVQTTVRLLKKSIGEIIKNLDLLRFILDCVKEMCKNVVKKLPVIKRYVPDWYKNQKMFDKVIPENSETFKSVLTAIRIKKFVIKLLIIMLMD